MHRVLLWLWSLAWPQPARRALRSLAAVWWLQRLVFPAFLVGVVGVIENDRGEFLLLRHTYRKDYPWGLPSGWLERGEQPADGLVREVEEETGLVVDHLRLWQVYAEPVHRHLNVVYRARYRSGQFVPSAEVSEVGFYALSNAPALLPDQQRLLAACQQEVKH